MEYFEKVVCDIHEQMKRNNIDGAISILSFAIFDSAQDSKLRSFAQEIVTNELQ